MAAEDGFSEATLELTLLSANLIRKPKPSSAFALSRSSSSSFAVAWIDPSIKRSTKTLADNNFRSILHFPLPPSLLRDPTSLLTIQILSSRLPFAGPKVVGAATLPLSSLRLGRLAEVRSLQLWKPSGRPCGTLHIASRVLCSLGETRRPPDVCCVLDPASPSTVDFLGVELPFIVDPSAPPMPIEDDVCQDLMSVDSAVPLLEVESSDCCDCPSVDSAEMAALDESMENIGSGNKQDEIGPRNLEDEQNQNGNGDGAWRSFLVGLASGTVAAVLVGASGFSEG